MLDTEEHAFRGGTTADRGAFFFIEYVPPRINPVIVAAALFLGATITALGMARQRPHASTSRPRVPGLQPVPLQ
jgi:hypothetical protein